MSVPRHLLCRSVSFTVRGSGERAESISDGLLGGIDGMRKEELREEREVGWEASEDDEDPGVELVGVLSCISWKCCHK